MLPVGHTHVDIDQLFSTISKKIKKSNIESLHELITTIKKSFKSEGTQPIIRLVHQYWDFKSWIKDNIQPFSGIKRFNSFCISKQDDNNYSIVKYKYHSHEELWIGAFEATRWTPKYPPKLIKIDINIENADIFSSLPFLCDDEKKRFLELVQSPSNYGNIFSDDDGEYNESFRKILNTPFILSHFFPQIDNYDEDGESTEDEEEVPVEKIIDFVRFPPSSKKIRKFKIDKGGFFVVSPIYCCDDHYQLVKVKNIPINDLCGGTWVDIRVFTRENSLYKKYLTNQIRINEIHSKVENLTKISKGIYSLSSKSHKKLNASVINKLKF